MSRTLRAWLLSRGDRERRLLGGAMLVAVVGIGTATALAVRDDLAALAARVASHERELATVRRLATAVTAHHGTTGPALLGDLQAAAQRAGLAERIAAIAPAVGDAPDGGGGRLGLRIAGASLAEAVALLHALDDEETHLGIARLVLRKHPDDRRRFDVTVEVSAGPARP